MHRETTTADSTESPGQQASPRELRSDDDAQSPSPRSYRGLLCVGAVILISSTIAYLRLRDYFFFYMDDFLQFDVAARAGLSKELLTLDVFQHFAPINRLGHLFMLDVLHLDPRSGAIVATGLVAAALTATAWMTYELGMSLLRRCLVLAACGGSLSFLDSAVWNDAAWHILGALTATYVVVALHLRALRTGRTRWHVLSVAAFAVGLLTQERAAFALPLIVLMDFFLLWQGVTLRQRVNRLWRLWAPLGAMAVIGVFAALNIKSNFGSSPGPGIRVTVKTVLMALTAYQFPQLAGIEPQQPIPLTAQLAVLALIGLVCAGLVWWNRRNLGPILFFFATFLLYWGFLAFSPLLDADSAVSTAARLHNSSYLTVPAFVAIFSLRLRRDPAPSTRPGAAGVIPAGRRAVAIGGTALVAAALAYVTAMGGIFVAQTWALQQSGHDYLANMADSKQSWMNPEVTVIPMSAPAGVVSEWAVNYGRTDRLLALIQPGWTPGDVTDRLAFFDQQGNLVKASVQNMAAATPTLPAQSTGAAGQQPGGSCVQDTGGLQIGLNREVPGGTPLLAELSYTSDIDGQLLTGSTAAGVSVSAADPYPISRGSHTVFLPLPDAPGPIDRVNLDGLAGGTLCVSALTVVRPLLAQPDGSCWVVDRYGTWIAPPTSAPCTPVAVN